MPLVNGHQVGVYVIKNLIDGKVYVGGAYRSFDARRRSHWNSLKRGGHGNQHLQNAWNKYGGSSFKFVIHEICENSIATIAGRETYWIAEFNATNRKFGYNKSPTGGSPKGTKHPPEYGRAVSERNLRMSDETKARIGAKSKGRKKSAQAKKKLSEASKRLWQDPNHRAHMSKMLKGKKRTEEWKRKMSQIMTGRKLSEEHRAKCGNGNRGRKQSPEEIERRSAKLRGKKRSPEVIARIAAANRGKKRSPEVRARMVEERRRNKAKRSLALKGCNLGRKLTEEHKAKIRAGQLRPETRARKVAAANAQWARKRAEESNNA